MSRRDDAFYLVISLDRPYDVHVNDFTVSGAHTIEVPFATRASAERAMGGLMYHVRESHPIVQGDVISDVPAIER